MAALLIRDADTVQLQPDLIRPRVPQTLLDIASFNELAVGATAAPAIEALRANDCLRAPEPTGFIVLPGILSRFDQLPLMDKGTPLSLANMNAVTGHMRDLCTQSAQLTALTRTWQSLLNLQAPAIAHTLAVPARDRRIRDTRHAPGDPREAPQTTPRQTTCRSQAYGQFLELAQWLDRNRAETADLLGIGRTTPSAWERDGREPQARHARRLYQTHALVSALAARQGLEETQRWLRSDSPSPLELISEGRLDLAEDRAHTLIYGPVAGATGPIDRLQAPDSPDVTLTSTDRPVRRRRVTARTPRTST